MSRERKIEIKPGMSIQVYIPQTVEPEIIEWMNNNTPLNNYILDAIREKLGMKPPSNISLEGINGSIEQVFEKMFRDKLQKIREEVLTAVSNSGSSKQVLESANEAFESASTAEALKKVQTMKEVFTMKL